MTSPTTIPESAMGDDLYANLTWGLVPLVDLREKNDADSDVYRKVVTARVILCFSLGAICGDGAPGHHLLSISKESSISLPRMAGLTS